MEKHIPTCAESFDRIFCWDLSDKIRQFFPRFVIGVRLRKFLLRWFVFAGSKRPCRAVTSPYTSPKAAASERMEGTKNRRAGRQACILDTGCELTSGISQFQSQQEIPHSSFDISHFSLIESKQKGRQNKVGKTESPIDHPTSRSRFPWVVHLKQTRLPNSFCFGQQRNGSH